MIVLNKNQANTVILTLTEKVTITSPYFLFRFISIADLSEKLCLAADTSSYTDRYNKFTITDSTTEDAANGTLNFLPQGQWKYEAYEQASSSNLLLANTGAMVEQGLVDVVGTGVTYARRTTRKTYKSYGTGA